jgi:parallel beta-helix repeat protein
MLKIVSGNSDNSVFIENIHFGGNAEINYSFINSTGSIDLNEINSSGDGKILSDMNNSTNSIVINDISFNGELSNVFLTQSGSLRAQLQYLSASDFNSIYISGLWNFNLQNDLVIPLGTHLTLFNKAGEQLNDIEFTTQSKLYINGICEVTGNLNYNRDLYISNTGLLKIRAFDGPSLTENYLKISSGYGIICDGLFDANGLTDSLYLDVNGSGSWNGITCQNNGNFLMNNVKVRNALTGIYINNPLGTVDIQNSRFSDNQVHDVFMENLPQTSELPRLIKNNIFTGNSNKISGLTCNNGVNILIENNIFDDDYSNGISLLYMTDPNLVSNIFAATLTSGYTPFGIYAYSSGGFYSCNNITNYSSGIKLDNSSPFIYNNDIFNNGTGIFLQNNSNPILTPAYSPGGTTLYTGGYNRIFNNLNEEIFCYNTSIFVPTSIPIMDYGYNSIYDENSDCLLDVGIVGYVPEYTYYIRDNYWGGGDPQTRLCGDNVIFEYNPYLEGEPEPPGSCFPFTEMSNNSSMSQSTLLLGSAIIDEYNGNISSAVDKYEDLIDPAGNKHYSFLALSKILYSVSKAQNPDFFALENYYSAISGQYLSDTIFSRKSSAFSTSADVEQPSYPEAIGEYQAVINNPLNEYERHYAYIDQLRTFRLMLDSLLSGFDNGPNGFNMNENEFKLVIEKGLNLKFDKDISSSKQRKVKNESNGKGRSGELISNISESDRKMQIDGLKRSLRLENVVTSNLSNSEKISLLNRVISFKLFEYSVLNDPNNSRPLNRVIVSKKTSSITGHLPVNFRLHQNYPNPFNPISTIKFDIPKESKVIIKIYDLIGREVMTLVNELKQPGFYETAFDGRNLASGLYIYRIEAGQFVDVKKMVLVK